MNETQKKIKSINKQLKQIHKKQRKIERSNCVDWMDESMNFSAPLTVYSWSDCGHAFKHGYIPAAVLSSAICNIMEYLWKKLGPYSAITTVLLWIALIPTMMVDVVTYPLVLVHNFVTMSIFHGIRNPIVKHSKAKWEKNLVNTQKLIDDLKNKRSELLVQTNGLKYIENELSSVEKENLVEKHKKVKPAKRKSRDNAKLIAKYFASKDKASAQIAKNDFNHNIQL